MAQILMKLKNITKYLGVTVKWGPSGGFKVWVRSKDDGKLVAANCV